ncbi:hypothetical protein RhiJN_25987 [Ceratobasidium sp. AG-Ba]|nr:hypothetical protein RhiJN_25987 [Ceratobasidium sp. AG-Ba]
MSNNANPSGQAQLPYYVAKYKGRSVAIKRDSDYQATIKLMQKSIAKLRSAGPQDIIISTELADYGDAVVQISEEIWPDVVDNVKIVEVALEDLTDSGSSIPVLAQTDTAGIAHLNPGAEVGSVDPNLNPIDSCVRDFVNSSSKPGGPIPITLRTIFHELITLGDFSLSATLIELSGTRLDDSFKLESQSYVYSMLGNLPLVDCFQSVYFALNTPSAIPAFEPDLESKKYWVYWDGMTLTQASGLSSEALPVMFSNLSDTVESYRLAQSLTFHNSATVPLDDVENYVSSIFKSLRLPQADMLRYASPL